MPPAPIGETITYGPRRVPASSGMVSGEYSRGGAAVSPIHSGPRTCVEFAVRALLPLYSLNNLGRPCPMRHLLAAAVLSAALLHAQTFVPRVNTGARLEPRGVVMHGAGQDPAAFANYWNALPVGRQPIAYMDYLYIDTIQPDWADAKKAELLKYPGNFVVFQIGLQMSYGPAQHLEAQVAAGAYDAQVGYLVAGLRKLATPVYLRIGYEFNGVGWEGYTPASYIQAFQRITNMLR